MEESKTVTVPATISLVTGTESEEESITITTTMITNNENDDNDNNDSDSATSSSSSSSSAAPAAVVSRLGRGRGRGLHLNANAALSSSSWMYSTPSKKYSEMIKAENSILQRVAELREEGRWEKRLNKQSEPPKFRAHWDCLLEEMKWMANEFSYEKRWKKAKSKRLVRMTSKHFQEKESQLLKAEKEEEIGKKMTAANIANLVLQFWSNVKTVVEFKEQSIIESLRKKALNQKLSCLVNETEKYSKSVAQSISYATELKSESDKHSIASNSTPSIQENKLEEDDTEFVPPEDSESDVDDTIAAEEAEAKKDSVEDYKNEIDELEAENEMSIEELLAKYAGYSDEANPSEGRPRRVTKSRSRDRSSSSPIPERQLRPRRSNVKMKIKEEPEENETEKSDLASLVTPEEDANKLTELAQSFQPKGFTLSSTNVVTKVPYILQHPLREYQHIGLDWLVAMYDKKLNGILADEMGLGKTIQTIALLAYLAVERGNWGPHLIVVPSSVMLNWELELLKWCPGLKIMTYYGSSKKQRKLIRKGWSQRNFFHVCITSYNIVIKDHQIFRRKHWSYLILDEAHNIKNWKSRRWQLLLNFNSQRRLLLTGTPLQNNLMELWSLLHFLMPNVFQSQMEFKDWFSNPMAGMVEGTREYNEEIVERLHKVLRPFILRRMKADVEKQLPKKYEHVVMCSLSKRQRFLYEEFMSRAKTKNTLSQGNLLSVINVLMQLRKVCNHPDLFEPRPIVSPFQSEGISSYEVPSCLWDLWREKKEDYFLKNFPLFNVTNSEFSYSESEAQRIKALIPPPFVYDPATESVAGACEPPPFPKSVVPLFSSDEKFEFKVTLLDQVEEVGEDYDYDEEELEKKEKAMASFLEAMGCAVEEFELDYIQERIVRDRELVVENLSKLNLDRCHNSVHTFMNEELIESCGIVGKLPYFGGSSLSQWKGESLLIPARDYEANGYFNLGLNEITTLINIRQANPSLLSHPRFLWSMTDALNSIVISPETRLSSLMEIVKRFVRYIPAVSAPSVEKRSFRPSTSLEYFDHLREMNEYRKVFSKPSHILHPTASRMLTQFPDPRQIQYDCGKLQALDGLLRRLKCGGHRILIFTQMGKVLDILESFLNYHGHTYLRLDGATKIDQRQLRMDRFNKDPKIFCFILSTRAGGIGVNLTGADTVIFYDSDWNPTMDAQAQDRCHRIGQTRDVHIYRLVSEKTVEENILKKANQKRLLGELAIEGGRFTTAFFKKGTIRELFEIKDDKTDDDDGGVALDLMETESLPVEKTLKQEMRMIECALAAAEDETDVQAARTLHAEVEAEMAEFDEDNNMPLGRANQDLNRVEAEFQQVFEQLNDVERYAIRLMEASINDWSKKETVAEAKKDLEEQRLAWELQQQQQKKKESSSKLAKMPTKVEEGGMRNAVGNEDEKKKVSTSGATAAADGGSRGGNSGYRRLPRKCKQN